MDNSPKLLIVNSSLHFNDLISHWLTQEGFSHVYTVDSGAGALLKAELFEIDIAIVNVELPDISGYDLCKKLKEAMPYILVLCISHVDNESNIIRAMGAGADDYYAEKVFDNYQFLAKIRNLVRLKHLSSQIRKQYEELEERNQLIKHHMQMARKVQRSLIPDIDMEFKNCHLLSEYLPAMGVGGDFYNVLKLNDSCFGIVMGDVSGHGIASSFLTVTINVMIKNLSNRSLNPEELLFHLNNELCDLIELGEDNPTLYACVFYAIVDTTEKKIKFANAGLVLPMLVNGTTGEVSELEATGAPIGMMAGTNYEQKAVSYQEKDMVLFFTDGLQDIYYKNQPDEFSRQIKDLLFEMYSYEDMREILECICRYFYKADATENERMEMDDVSMLLCKLG